MNQSLQNNQDNQTNILEQIPRYKFKKYLRKTGKKAIRHLSKTYISAIKGGFKLLIRLLWSLLSMIGLPILLITIGIIILLLILSIATNISLSTGEGLTGNELEIHNYIVEESNNTVDMENVWERPYRVPVELISSTIQLDYFNSYSKDEIKEVIHKMTNQLKPIFEYGTYNEWTETQVLVYEDGKLIEDKGIKKTDNLVKKLDKVNHWDGITIYTHTPYTTPWQISESISYREENGRQIEIKTVTKTRHQYFNTTSSSQIDYTRLDNALNSFGFNWEDKALIEANYEIAAQTDIFYVEWLNPFYFDGEYYFFPGEIIPGDNVPAQFMPIYRGAEQKYNIPWYIIAAIHFVETGFSTSPTMVSSAGAIGPFQFLPATWVGWKYDIGGGIVSPDLDITDLNIIKDGNGYGVDANGDGKADPWDVMDAAYSVANYLNKNNFSQDPRSAIWQYNHAEWYVDKVLETAEKFKNEATYVYNGDEIPELNPGSFMRPTTGPITSNFGIRQLCSTCIPDFHYGIDFGSGGKDNLPIFASADGIVSRSYTSSSYGNVVFILHEINGQTYETVYAHMKTFFVQEGDKVKQGDIIGIMGSTGYSTGVHLHFEVHLGRWNQNKSNAIDPAIVLGN